MNQHSVKIPQISVIFLVCFLASCSFVRDINQAFNPVNAAETTEQKAFALYGLYDIIQDEALTIIKNKRIPVSTRRAVRQAIRLAKPLADNLLDVTLTLQRNRKDIINQAVLDELIENVKDAMLRLDQAIKTVKSTMRLYDAKR